MDEHRDHERYARVAVAILAAGVLAEIARLFEPWPGFSAASSRTVSVLLIVFWSASALAVALREKSNLIAMAAWWFAFAAPIAMLTHGSVTRVGGNLLGLIYIAASALLGFCLKRTFDRERQRHAYRTPGESMAANDSVR